MRYVLNDPTSWAFDLSYLMYGAVFYMAGAYTLSRGGHVRADMFYRKWRPRTQAVVELALYVLFFFPGILALVVAGWRYGFESMRIREVSVNSPAGVPIWPLKMMIPFGAGADRAAGSGRGAALRRLPARRRLGAAPARRRGTRNADPAAARGQGRRQPAVAQGGRTR